MWAGSNRVQAFDTPLFYPDSRGNGPHLSFVDGLRADDPQPDPFAECRPWNSRRPCAHHASTHRHKDVSALDQYETRPRQAAYYRELLDRVQKVPGVRAAAVVNNLPLSGSST